MSIEDVMGLTVSTKNFAVIESVNLFTTELVRLGQHSDSILEAAQQYPDSPLLLIYAAVLNLHGQTAENFQIAYQYLQQAKKFLPDCSEREKSWYRTAFLWQKRAFKATLQHVEGHCRNWPKDLAAIKVCEYLYFCNGQKFQSEHFLKLTKSCYQENRHHAHFLSIHAFAHELTGDLVNAENIAEQALALDSENPWAHHCLSHVYLNRGQSDQGIHLLESFCSIWQRSDRLIESHNMWHLALLYLENLDFKKTIEVYRRVAWKGNASSVPEEIDAASLLWRLDMEGHKEEDLWEDLSQAIGNHALFPVIPFVSAQLCYALKRGKKEEAVAQSLQQIEAFIQKQRGKDREVWEQVGLPLVLAALSFAEENYTQVLERLDPIIDRVSCVGGSDAQIDLFYQTYFKALIGAKRKQDASRFLEKHIGKRSYTPLEDKWRNECKD